MKGINYLYVLFFLLLFSVNSIGNVLTQSSPFPVVNITENWIQDHSRTHDCTIDGDDLIYRMTYIPKKPAYLSTELLNLYCENEIAGLCSFIWQPPKF